MPTSMPGFIWGLNCRYASISSRLRWKLDLGSAVSVRMRSRVHIGELLLSVGIYS
jgi:hypothetical protein